MFNLNKLIAKIGLSQNILVITHENPDGDALGSMIALSLVFKNLQKSADIVCASEIPTPFTFLPGTEQIKKDFLLGDYDLVFILDCGDFRRTGFSERLKNFSQRNRKKIINIDHHPKNDIHRYIGLNLVNYDVSSTSEIVYELMKGMEVKIDKEIATALLCGLYTDTGAFRHSNTSSRVLQIASDLLQHGARLKHITKNITNGKSVSTLKLWGVVLSRIKKNNRLGLVTSVITKEDLIVCQSTPQDLAGAVNLINSIPGTRAAILFAQVEDDKIKASIRTERNDIDISRLANIFDGGGLKKASGFTVSGRLTTDKKGGWKII